MNSSYLQTTYIVIDLETTGFSPYENEIIEIGAIKINNLKTITQFSTYVKPNTFPIPPKIANITNISNESLIKAPKLTEIWKPFLNFIGDYPLIAHNASFDRSFINYAAQIHGENPPKNKTICTLKLAKKILINSNISSLKLNDIAKFLNCKNRPTHRALTDAYTTAEIFYALLKKSETPDIDSIIQTAILN